MPSFTIPSPRFARNFSARKLSRTTTTPSLTSLTSITSITTISSASSDSSIDTTTESTTASTELEPERSVTDSDVPNSNSTATADPTAELMASVASYLASVFFTHLGSQARHSAWMAANLTTKPSLKPLAGELLATTIRVFGILTALFALVTMPFNLVLHPLDSLLPEALQLHRAVFTPAPITGAFGFTLVMKNWATLLSIKGRDDGHSLYPRTEPVPCSSYADLGLFVIVMVREWSAITQRIMRRVFHYFLASIVIALLERLGNLYACLETINLFDLAWEIRRATREIIAPSGPLATPPSIEALFTPAPTPTPTVMVDEYLPEAYTPSEGKYLRAKALNQALYYGTTPRPTKLKLSAKIRKVFRPRKTARLAAQYGTSLGAYEPITPELRAFASNHVLGEDAIWAAHYAESRRLSLQHIIAAEVMQEGEGEEEEEYDEFEDSDGSDEWVF